MLTAKSTTARGSRRALRVLTNSELKCSRRCAREHHISYELGIRSAEPKAAPLRFGTLIHTALEAWWGERSEEYRLAAALATIPLDGDPYELARAVEMLSGYNARWITEPIEVLRVEAEFRAPLLNPYSLEPSERAQLGGKIDAIVRDLRDDHTYIVEHKTTSEDLTLGSLYWQLLRIDTQISTYYAGARALGFDPYGVIYDVLGKPQQRPLSATPIDKRQYTKSGELYARQRAEDETPTEYGARVRDAIAAAPDDYYQRGTVVRLESEESEARLDTWMQAHAIATSALAARWPRNPDSCKRFGRLCSYFGVCTGIEALSDPALYRRVDNVHEELTP